MRARGGFSPRRFRVCAVFLVLSDASTKSLTGAPSLLYICAYFQGSAQGFSARCLTCLPSSSSRAMLPHTLSPCHTRKYTGMKFWICWQQADKHHIRAPLANIHPTIPPRAHKHHQNPQRGFCQCTQGRPPPSSAPGRSPVASVRHKRHESGLPVGDCDHVRSRMCRRRPPLRALAESPEPHHSWNVKSSVKTSSSRRKRLWPTRTIAPAFSCLRTLYHVTSHSKSSPFIGLCRNLVCPGMWTYIGAFRVS